MKTLAVSITENRRTPLPFWSAVAERSADTAFWRRFAAPKRRGASLPAAVQRGWVGAVLRWAPLVVVLGLQPAAARTLDDFDDEVKTGWADFVTGLSGAITEAAGVLTLDAPTGLAGRPILAGSAKASERLAVQDGESIDLRVDLAGASDPSTFAVLAWVPDGRTVLEFTGYFIAKSANEIRVGKALHKYFWQDQPQPPLPHANVTLALSLALADGAVTLRAQVLDRDAGNAVLFDRSFVDSPAADALASGTDDPAAPFTGPGQFVLLAYAEPGPDTPSSVQVSFDDAEVSTAAPTNLLPVIHDVIPANTASFLLLDTKFRLLATDDKTWWDPDPEGGAGFADGPFFLAVGRDADRRTLRVSAIAAVAARNEDYTARLLAVDSEGGSNGMAFRFDTFCPGTRVVEVEDYDFGGGQFVDLPSFADYLRQVSVPEVDFHVGNAQSGVSIYRPEDPVPTRSGVDYLRPSVLAVGDYEVTGLTAGDYLTYTRTIAEADYSVYLRAAVLNLDQAEAILERVSRASTDGETATVLGHFFAPRCGFEYRNVPLADESGAPVKAHLGGVETLRLRLVTAVPSDAELSLNYLVFATEMDRCLVLESAPDPVGPFTQDLTAGVQGTIVTVKPLAEPARFFRVSADVPLEILNLRRAGDALVFEVQP